MRTRKGAALSDGARIPTIRCAGSSATHRKHVNQLSQTCRPPASSLSATRRGSIGQLPRARQPVAMNPPSNRASPQIACKPQPAKPPASVNRLQTGRPKARQLPAARAA